jgi:Protein of unknown function (DUF1593)
MKKAIFFLFFGIVYTTFGQSPQSHLPRTIVTTDGEIDDVDSYIRMLLYSNEFKIEGLVYSSSQWHYKGDGKGTKFVSEMEMTKNLYHEKTDLRWPGSTWMNGLLDAYEKVYPNLVKHAKGYPKADYLRSVVRVGNIDFEGEMEKITEGSEFIKNKLLDETTEPIYLQVWGGTNTIARALKSIEEQYQNTADWQKVYQKVCKKAIIYAILDQDATYRKYVSKNWKDIKIYYNSNQFWCFAYPWKRAVPKEQHYLFEGGFMGDKIINNHGPLTKMYYSYGDGQKQEGDDEHVHGDLSKVKQGDFGKYDFISEGDSPAYLHLVDIGLDNLNNPQWGGWGGRLVQSKTDPNRWEDGKEATDYNPFTKKMDATYPQIRWVEAIQNDFAARADWCVKDVKDANHAPKVMVNNKRLMINGGQKISLKAKTSDPDGNKVNVKFWQYQEVGNNDKKLDIVANGNNANISIPSSAKAGDTFHVIVEGTDTGTPALTKYQRVVLTVK